MQCRALMHMSRKKGDSEASNVCAVFVCSAICRFQVEIGVNLTKALNFFYSGFEHYSVVNAELLQADLIFSIDHV